MNGYVYFIGPAIHLRRVKIGFTKVGIVNRLTALQTGSAWPLKIYGFVQGDIQLERVLHETFAPLRLQGEWFNLELKLLAFLTYLEEATLENRPVSERELNSALNDVVASEYPVHHSIGDDEWINSADSYPLSCWLHDRAWAEHQGGVQ